MVMPGVRHRGARRFGALLLLALLWCPIALSGHRHLDSDLGASRAGCTMCAVTAHAPALGPSALPHFVLHQQGDIPALGASTPSALGEACTLGPRAPPRSSSIELA